MKKREFHRFWLALSLVAAATAAAAGQTKSGGIRAGIMDASRVEGSLIGIQYENWFVPGQADWETAEATPILGRYTSYDVNVMKKHFEWFDYLGIDWLLIDWSNMLWMKPAWEKHRGGSRELEKTVEVLFETCLQLQREGKYAPKLVFMLGLQNGPPLAGGVKRLNGIIAWINRKYLRKPDYNNLWLYYEGKPLLTVLYWPPNPCEQIGKDLERTPLTAERWAVRWMSSQLQDNHAERCGMWSWMDGTIRQKVTYHEGRAEETVVTPACFPFPSRGWLHGDAVGRDHGAPYIESWKEAFENRPKFIQVHQWNEFAGQKDGQGFPSDYWGITGKPAKPTQNVFGDEYSPELSDDIEPTQISGCGYRGCGGWGYYFVNLTKALISLYRKETPDITVMAVSAAFHPAAVKTERFRLTWNFLGHAPTSYTIRLDGKVVARNVHSLQYQLDLSTIAAGRHTAEVVAEGAHTYFDLAPDRLTRKDPKPLPVQSAVEFTLSP